MFRPAEERSSFTRFKIFILMNVEAKTFLTFEAHTNDWVIATFQVLRDVSTSVPRSHLLWASKVGGGHPSPRGASNSDQGLSRFC